MARTPGVSTQMPVSQYPSLMTQPLTDNGSMVMTPIMDLQSRYHASTTTTGSDTSAENGPGYRKPVIPKHILESQIRLNRLAKSVPDAKKLTRAMSAIERTAPNRTEDNIDYKEFLDKHYEDMRPGIHKIKYRKSEYQTVIQEASAIFASENTLIDVDPPCVVVGDLHGQFNDLINMFLLLGRPPDTVYVFTGDYVDRGMMSIECIMLLFAYKISYPENIFLLRGNHEIARVNKKYGFYEECISCIPKYGEEIWAEFQRCFNNLPISALIATKILCMHGGLSPSLVTLDELREHPKPIRNPFRGIVNDMLWSDPDLAVYEWRTSTRGSGFTFGTNVIDDVCTRLGIELIIRAHQMCFDGYWTITNRKLITIFSAPLYCNLYRNAGCVLKVDAKLCIQPVFFAPESPALIATIQQKNRVWDVSFDNID
ncbi:unnamed protein product [Caenorhabditis bovis]|uniref:Serine/threonine-protein phosphatase n=1 Tax=Caenorhabditis bovis TaxID=2654633 RepID=A0A8S1ETM9_9PELO|nr:unnamed protein product [Caenorhabditis bovis]